MRRAQCVFAGGRVLGHLLLKSGDDCDDREASVSTRSVSTLHKQRFPVTISSQRGAPRALPTARFVDRASSTSRRGSQRVLRTKCTPARVRVCHGVKSVGAYS